MDCFNEKDYQLKYFYLIDSDKIIYKIKNHLEHNMIIKHSKGFHEKLFQTIYSKITEASVSYTDFIFSPNSFNYKKANVDTNITETYAPLLRVILQNHCILHGFCTSLKNENAQVQTKISGVNDSQIKQGYFKTYASIENSQPPQESNNKTPEEYNADIKNDISQLYNKYLKRYLKNPEYYSTKILNHLFPTKRRNFLEVPSFSANYVGFLFSNPAVYSLNKDITNYPTLKNKQALTSKYINLNKACLNWIADNKLCMEDQLVFEQAMESIYGFSFFKSASNLLHLLHDSNSTPDTLTYKDLEGESILTNIKQAAQLPITYNRYIFLEYSISRVLSSNILESNAYALNDNALFSTVTQDPSDKSQLVLTGLSHIEKYLRKLKYVAIPILEYLWDVIVDKLSNEYSIDTDSYRDYICTHFDLITTDYSCLTQEHLHLIRNEVFFDDIDRDFFNGTIPCYGTPYDKTFLKTEHELESFKRLLLSYFKESRFTRPQQNVIDSLLEEPNGNNSAYGRKLVYINNQKDNIFKFIENLPPFSL